jgi:hypothetical protein
MGDRLPKRGVLPQGGSETQQAIEERGERKEESPNQQISKSTNIEVIEG